MANVQGHVAPGFERVADAFAQKLGDGGASFAAMQNGAALVDLWGGSADRQGVKPWARETIAPIYSATKPISALAMGRLFDTHGVRFETPVAAYWPEFAANGKAEITIAQALSHQAGVPGFREPIDPALWLDPAGLSAALANLAPLWPPGTASGYHPLTWGYLIGELVQRIAGRSLGTILREEICAPLGIEFWIGLPEELEPRVAEMKRPTRLPDLGDRTEIKRIAFLTKWSAPDRSGSTWRRIEIPSANGHGGARAVAQLYALYAESGGGVISPAAHAALVEHRIAGDDLVLPFQLDWRTGILSNLNNFFGPNPRAIGHYGWGGACGVADADEGLSIGYVMNQQSHHLLGDPRPCGLIATLYECLS